MGLASPTWPHEEPGGGALRIQSPHVLVWIWAGGPGASPILPLPSHDTDLTGPHVLCK